MQGVIAHRKCTGSQSRPEKTGDLKLRVQPRWGGGQDMAIGIGQYQRDIGSIADKDFREQRLAGIGIQVADLRRPGKCHEHEASVLNHPLMMGGHGLYLAKGIVFSILDHPAAQFPSSPQ